MSRMTTSLASFSAAYAAIWLACSRGVRRSASFSRSLSQCSRRLRRRQAPVEPEPLDEACDRGWDERIERLAARRAGAQLGRGERPRLDLEEADALGAGEPPEHRVDPAARVAGPGGDAELDVLEHGVRLLPGREVAELIGADQEDGAVVATVAQQVDRARGRVE